MSNDDTKWFELLQTSLSRLEKGQDEIKESSKFIERKVSELDKTTVRQQASLDEHIRRTNALEMLVTEVRTESRENIKLLRQDMEKKDKKLEEDLDQKLKPAVEVHKAMSGFWAVTKWVLGTIVAFGGAAGAVITVLKLFA